MTPYHIPSARYKMMSSLPKGLMTNWTRRNFLGSLTATAAATPLIAQERRTGQPKIKITDLRCAIIGRNPVIRIVTDQGVSGYGQAESSKAYLKPMVLFYKDYLVGEDPTDVERVMLKIRRLGAFKPWGAAVSAIEIALLGHRRSGRGSARLQTARRQNPRPRPDL